MPPKRRPLAEVQNNGRLHHLKRRKISEEQNSLSSKSYDPSGESSAFLHCTPIYQSPNQLAEPVRPDPATGNDRAQPLLPSAGFKPPAVEFQAVKGRTRQRISTRDLPGLPPYNPIEVPFEPHTARVSNL